MNEDLRLFRRRWWGVYVLVPVILLSAIPIALVSRDNLVAGYLWYAIDCLQAGALYASRRSEPALINAVLGLIVWGIPGLMIFWKARRQHSLS